MSKSKLYTLFVAIDEYPHVRKLGGCINDANNLSTYIKGATEALKKSHYNKLLYNEVATKQTIVETILNHLGQAKKEDLCLFYFSGHGGQEIAHPSFEKHEPDGQLEVLACYDSDPTLPGSFLADKELRYTFHQLYQKTKAQIITIFDCCHAGTNMRDKLIQRRLMSEAPMRNWEDFIFGKTIDETAVRNATALDEVLPQGQFLQLAACQNKESAFEVNGHGVFTTNLVDLLQQTKGDINYRDLVNILRNKIEGSFPQTPQLDIAGTPSWGFQSFLGGITAHQGHHANIVFNKEKDSWIMDRGAIHGIRNNSPKLKVQLFEKVAEGTGFANVDRVFIDKTHLSFSGDLNEELVYKVVVQGFTLYPLRIFLKGEEKGKKVIQEVFKNNQTQLEGISLISTEANADYILLVQDNELTILHPSNNLPMVSSCVGYTPASAELAISYCQHIAKWNELKLLANPDTNLHPNPPVTVTIYNSSSGSDEVVHPEKSNYTLPFMPNSDSGSMRIQVKNDTNQSYYIALIYLSQDFTIYPQLLEGQTIELPSQKTIWLHGGNPIPYQQESFIKQYNWEGETHYIKLIVGTESFDVTHFAQNPLPHPNCHTDNLRSGKKGFDTRGIAFRSNKPKVDWSTKTFIIKMPNPYYQSSPQ